MVWAIILANIINNFVHAFYRSTSLYGRSSFRPPEWTIKIYICCVCVCVKFKDSALPTDPFWRCTRGLGSALEDSVVHSRTLAVHSRTRQCTRGLSNAPEDLAACCRVPECTAESSSALPSPQVHCRVLECTAESSSALPSPRVHCRVLERTVK